MKINKKPTMLLILDGFGVNPTEEGNAIYQANTPGFDKIFSTYPHTTIEASGKDVGLPAGQMGNSEVGHMNIGAGRVIYQELLRISNAVEDGSIFQNEVLNKCMDDVLAKGTNLHLMGLLSDGGVHSHLTHLFALIKMAKGKGIKNIYIHCFLDGRDVPPTSAGSYLYSLMEYIQEIGAGEIATISGRYYAMDRDKRFDRIEKAYDAIVLGEGDEAVTPCGAIDMAYESETTDEFVLPTVVGGKPMADGDGVIMYNFRPDRAREITRSLVDENFDGFKRKKVLKNLSYVCMTQYDSTMPNVSVAFPPAKYKNTFGEYISSLGLSQLRIAETEKYAHVTFFFNGSVEEPNPGEDRILVPSPKVATYDLQPEMSAYIVTDKVLEAIESDKYDCIILNFANADMVGHTGVMDAAIKAIEALDTCVVKIVDAILAKGGQILLTADHGNADLMIDQNGNIVTAHSTNPVPLVNISDNPKSLKSGGKLADLAPTLLEMMGIPIPEEMTGNSLLEK